MQPMWILHCLQWAALLQYPWAGCRLKQLCGWHPPIGGAGTHSTSDRQIQSIYHWRGTYAVRLGFQCFPENTGRASTPCHIHPCHYREAQDIAHHPFTLPNIWFQPDWCGRYRSTPRICRLQRRYHCWTGSVECHCPQSRRRYARRTIHLRPGGKLHRRTHHL